MDQLVVIDYINHKGDRRIRKIKPISNSLYYGSTQWHPERQWLFQAYDVEDDNKLKDFAMSGIRNWMES